MYLSDLWVGQVCSDLQSFPWHLQRYNYLMYTYVLVKLQTRVQYHRLMVCLLTHHNIVYLCFVPKDISCTMLSSWEKKQKQKKRLFPKAKGSDIEVWLWHEFSK